MDLSSQSQRSIQVDTPYIMGYMSVDGHRRYHCDLSQLKFLTSMPKRKLDFNLNHNIESAVKRSSEENDEKISLLLKYLLDQKNDLKFLNSREDVTFISYRSTLISIMTCTHNQDPISIVASLFKNCIYLCSVSTATNAHDATPLTDQHLRICAWGYKFEQYMLADAPNHKPHIKTPINENEEFYLFYSAHIGRHKLFYASEIDGMLATHPSENLEPPETTDFKTNLHYLRKNQFVELKTNKEIHSHRQEQNFKKYKMFRCWCLCYLAALKGLVVGYRDDDGIIQRVQWFDTDDITRYCEAAWDPQTAIDYLDYFLSYVEKCFRALKTNSTDSFSTQVPLTLKFDIDSFQKITVTKDIYNDHEILPDWYITHILN